MWNDIVATAVGIVLTFTGAVSHHATQFTEKLGDALIPVTSTSISYARVPDRPRQNQGNILGESTTTPQATAQSTTVITHPVIERVIETVRTIVEGGIDEATLNDRLAALKIDFTGRISNVTASAATNATTITNVYETLGAVARIGNLDDINLSDSDIDGSRISGGSISGATISATSLTVSGSSDLGSLSATNLTLSGNLTVSGAQTLSGAITIPYLTATSTATASTFAGTVGIGTTTAASQLSIQQTGSNNLLDWYDATGVKQADIRLQGTGAVGSRGVALNMADVTGASGSSDNLFVLRFNGATNKLLFGVDATAAQIASANGHTLSFRAGAYSTTSPHLLISNSTGNVGVGTTTPGSLLSVGTTNGINFSTATSSFSSTGGINLAAGCFAIGGNCLTLASLGGTLGIGSGGTATTTFYNGGVLFSDGTKLTQSAAAANLYWDETNKRLGLGTAAPSSILHIEKNAAADNLDVKLKNTAADGISRLFVSNDANDELLVRVDGSGVGGTLFGLSRNALASIVSNSVSNFVLGTFDSIPLVLGTNNAERLRVTGDGNVGIGQTSPTYKLDVTGLGHFTGLVDAANFVATSTTATTTLAGGLAVETSGLVYDYSTNRVGIGTAAPSQKLTIEGTNSASDMNTLQVRYGTNENYAANLAFNHLQLGNDATNYIVGGSTGVGGSLQFVVNNTNNLAGTTVTPNGTTAMTLLSGGNVGIGTTSPSTKFSVGGAAGDATGHGYFTGGLGVGVVNTTAGSMQTSGEATIGGLLSATKTTGDQARFSGWGPIGTINGTTGSIVIGQPGYVGLNIFTVSDGATGADFDNIYDNANSATIFRGRSSGTPVPQLTLSGAGAVRFNAYGAGTLTTDGSGNITASSDERLKNIAGNFNRGLVDLEKLSPILYTWKPETGFDATTTYAGFSAQNVQLAIPEAIGQGKDGFLTLQERPLLATIVNAIKELAAKVADLADTIASFAEKIVTKELVAINVTATRGTFDQLCVKDDAGVPVCVTGTQLKSLLTGSVFGASAGISKPETEAAGAPSVGNANEATGGSSSSGGPAADTATSTTLAEATSTPAAANDNQPVAELAAEEPAPVAAVEEPEPELEAANDNEPADLPATGTE